MAEFEPTVEQKDALRLTADITDETEAVDTGPLYRVFKDTKIPVSKASGNLWHSRIEQAKSLRGDAETCWSEALRYYENDQSSHRTGIANRSGNNRYARTTLNAGWSATENVVFSNAATMLPLLYAKNPSIEVTSRNGEANEGFATTCEKLINELFSMTDAPGVNFKSKARRAVLGAYLMNSAYVQIDWIKKENSSEQAMTELQKLSQELENAKTTREIQEVEGKIAALESKISFLSPSGPSTRLRSTFCVYADPTGSEPDHSDCNWLSYFDYIPTAYLNAVYTTKDGDQRRSLYEPTHILRAGADVTNLDDEVNSFSLLSNSADDNAATYGYKNQAAFKTAQHTKVWYIWDKTTRRVHLYADNSWTWPIWVWDDPLKLLRFFPLYRLHFHETPEGSQPKGEVTYYLDQQDTINDINSTLNQARKWAKHNVFFNKNAISQEEVQAVLKGDDGTARGLDIPEGQTIKDVLFSVVPPSLSFPELLDTSKQFESINRISGISSAQRGAEFKTNTTNQAVDAYQKNVDIRVDEKGDAIEDWIGEIAWGLIQLCCANWSQQEVADIIGAEYAKNWKQVQDPQQLRTILSLRIVGGSKDKPTSKAKKQEALQLGQIMGQFANAVPGIGILMMKMLQRAFNNELVIDDNDWQMLLQSMQQQQQKAGGGPNGEQGGPPQPGQEQEADPSPEQKQQIEQLIRSLPEEAKQQLDQLIQQGASPTEALKQVMQSQQQSPQ